MNRNGYVLFWMRQDLRQSIIADHLFYLQQARKRLLSQFADMESDARRATEDWLGRHGQQMDPDFFDASDIAEAAEEVGIDFYQRLSEMKEQTFLSVAAGMFYLWESSSRSGLSARLTTGILATA